MANKKIIVIAIVILLLLLAITGILLGMFLPRNIVNVVQIKDIVKIEVYEYSDLKEVLSKELNDEKLQKFLKDFSNKKYVPRYSQVKEVSKEKIKFYYSDESTIEYSDLFIRFIDAEGNVEGIKIYENAVK